MALTRKFLDALGIEGDKQDEIISAHTETVNGLKQQVAQYKDDAEKLAEVQAELDSLKEAAAKNGGKNPFEVKYNAIKEEFDNYKAEQAKKETQAAKEAAYKDLLKAAGISEKRIDAVVRVSDLDSVELDKDGKIKDAEKLTESIKTEWADFITTTQVKGAEVSNPPANNGGSAFEQMPLAEKMQYANDHPDDQAVKDWLGK